ncbi:hypothetical protein M3O44_20755, partial [Xanthomonas nasturtii]|nr:hypothetical protein [Xanthomonas nasturtii]
MTHPLDDIISSYIDTPNGGLVLEGIKIGRVKFEKITITNREGAFNAQDLINTVLSKTARIRSGKHGTRYAELLPPGSPARLLSIEIEDFSLVAPEKSPSSTKGQRRPVHQAQGCP